tara:strand:- start:504 stop:1694 length:1191 start_codon:yes stop_codon:yes gene_type:complete
MAITDNKQGVWLLDQTYNKINKGEIWRYSGEKALWVQGKNHKGQLGQNNRTNYSSPVQIPGTNWDKILTSNNHFDSMGVLATKQDGTLWAWGGNSNGQLGLNTQSSSPDEQNFVSSPTQIPGTSWSGGAAGYRASIVTKTDGSAWVMGNAGDGALGLNSTVQRSSPTQLPGTWALGRDKQSGGHNVMLAINGAGQLMAWGESTYGNLGGNLGHGSKRSSPIQIASGTWSTVCDGGYNHMGAVNDDGELWTWGKNDYGGLGHNDRTNRSSPKQVGSGTNWHKCSITEHNTIASKTDGTLWAMGRGEFGELGQNNRTYYSNPQQIPGTNWDINNFQIGMGVRAMKTDGTLWMWGRQDTGQWGTDIGGNYYRSSPVQVPGTVYYSVDSMYRSTYVVREV